MTSTQAVALYAGLNIALLVLLAIRVVGRRRSAQVSVGDGGDEDLALRIRTHGNAAEYVPAFLVGLFLSAPWAARSGVCTLLAAASRWAACCMPLASPPQRWRRGRWACC